MVFYLLIRTSHVNEHFPLHIHLKPKYQIERNIYNNQYIIRFFQYFIEIYGEDNDDYKYKTFNWCTYVFLLNYKLQIIPFPEWFIDQLYNAFKNLDDFDFLRILDVFKCLGMDGYGYAIFAIPVYSLFQIIKLVANGDSFGLIDLFSNTLVLQIEGITNQNHSAYGNYYLLIRNGMSKESYSNDHIAFYYLWLLTKLKIVEDKDFKFIAELNERFARYFY